MTTLKQKLPRIPSPIREMIVENIKSSDWGDRLTGDNIDVSFQWDAAKHIPDWYFWDGIYYEIRLIK